MTQTLEMTISKDQKEIVIPTQGFLFDQEGVVVIHLIISKEQI